tara:strand:+ start:9164 stop:9883 length:720 start_codon:yes stop_codon:yes gene_type:complete
MVILTTLYNAENYIERCINSIISQNYTDFKCYITDDMSTDNSVNIVKNVILNDDRFILIENTKKLYQPGNYDQVIRHNKSIDDNEIIIEVDGDDWLPDPHVFDRVKNIYENQDIWLANGSFIYSDGRPGFAAPPNNIDNIRHEFFTASHLRTWRAFLWRNIEEDYLKDSNGNYWEVAGDLAFMYPMIEMSGPEHYHFMREINYIYNEENPLNDHKANIVKVNKVRSIIPNNKKYDRLIR